MKTKEKQNIYKQAQRFAEITQSCLKNGNIQRAKHYMKIAGNLFTYGNKEVQNAITNVYLHSVSIFMEINHYNIGAFLPSNLQIEYYKQTNTSGI